MRAGKSCPAYCPHPGGRVPFTHRSSQTSDKEGTGQKPQAAGICEEGTFLCDTLQRLILEALDAH